MEPQLSQCRRCGQAFDEAVDLISESFSGSRTCFECQCAALFDRLGPQAQGELDEHIYAQRIIVGMRTIRQQLRSQGLAVEFQVGTLLYSWRYGRLKKLTPDRLPYPDAQYWGGFYS